MFRLLSRIFFLLFIHDAYGAACCSSGASTVNIMTGDEQSQISTNFQYETVVGEAPAEGLPIFRNEEHVENSQKISLNGSYLTSDRTQASVSIPVVRNYVNRFGSKDVSAGLGDVQISGAFETIPEWTYNPFKPHVYNYLQATFPTGKSVYQDPEVTRGKGFYTLSTGALFLKTWNGIDSSLQVEAYHSFNRKDSEGNSIKPGFGFNGTLGFGYNLNDFRLGPSFSYNYEDPVKVNEAHTGPKEVWGLGAGLSYLWNLKWTSLLSYNDQTLLGPAKNTNLNRSVTLSLKYRVMR